MFEFSMVPRDSLDTLVNGRNRALDNYEAVHASLLETQRLLDVAHASATTSTTNAYNYHLRHEKADFFRPCHVPGHDAYMKTAQRIVDTDAWSRLMDVLGLDRLMDKQEKDKLRDSLIHNPPPVTLENVLATVERIRGDVHVIFLRGIANAFARLDRRFRSHDGWKLGSRMILTNAIGDYGRWHYGNHHEATLLDVERVFCVLSAPIMDENGETRRHEVGYRSEVVLAVDEAAKTTGSRTGVTVETRFFKVRTYQNGNVHVWFKDDDLLQKVNRALAAYYGEVLGEGDVQEEAQKKADLHNAKTSLAKNFGFFPTPERATATLIEGVRLSPGDRVLEPSAGTGNLALALKRKGADVQCVEVQPELAKQLHGMGFATHTGDFLTYNKMPGEHFDHVVMNPPFNRERDIDHVMHALTFVEGTGSLHAIMSAGTEFRQTKKARAFREYLLRLASNRTTFTKAELDDWQDTLRTLSWKDSRNAKAHVSWEDLPAGSFTESGTNVNTCILRINFR